MTASLETGLILLIVGMATVLFVLGIVVYTGKLLILVANKFPERQHSSPPLPSPRLSDDLSGAKVAAITGAIMAATGGKGQITNIERVD